MHNRLKLIKMIFFTGSLICQAIAGSDRYVSIKSPTLETHAQIPLSPPSRAAASNQPSTVDCDSSNFGDTYKEYQGTYKQDDYFMVTVKFRAGDLLLTPGYWRSIQFLAQVGTDSFVCKRHEKLQAVFIRDSSGKVAAVELKGFNDEKGVYKRITPGTHPVELIFAGKVEEAIERLSKSTVDESRLVNMGTTIGTRIPSQAQHAEEFLDKFATVFSGHSDLFLSLGDISVITGHRKKAAEYYQKAWQLNNQSERAGHGFKRLKVIPYSKSDIDRSWRLPFALDDLFKRPTAAEIDAVKYDWAKRDLSPKEVAVVQKDTMRFGSVQATVNIVSHRVRGFLHYGAIIVPVGAGAGTCAALVECKGVSWNYSPLDLSDGDAIHTPEMMCEAGNNLVYIIPSFRGERLIFKGKEYQSEGDRTDSWDGAADDGIAFLNAALEITPEIDNSKIIAFGKSRGGSVALLMGIRDKRVKRVIDWTGPTDWFDYMGKDGWTQQELAEAGLMRRSQPDQVGGQFIERILKKTIDGQDGLADARKRMIASSPLYFADDLPHTQIHYGVDDNIVPLINGKGLAEKLRAGKSKPREFEAYFHEGAGHDLDRSLAYKKSREFILKLLVITK